MGGCACKGLKGGNQKRTGVKGGGAREEVVGSFTNCKKVKIIFGHSVNIHRLQTSSFSFSSNVET